MLPRGAERRRVQPRARGRAARGHGRDRWSRRTASHRDRGFYRSRIRSDARLRLRPARRDLRRARERAARARRASRSSWPARAAAALAARRPRSAVARGRVVRARVPASIRRRGRRRPRGLADRGAPADRAPDDPHQRAGRPAARAAADPDALPRPRAARPAARRVPRRAARRRSGSRRRRCPTGSAPARRASSSGRSAALVARGGRAARARPGGVYIARASLAEAGLLHRPQPRPRRAREPRVRALHVADPPLPRPGRPPRRCCPPSGARGTRPSPRWCARRGCTARSASARRRRSERDADAVCAAVPARARAVRGGLGAAVRGRGLRRGRGGRVRALRRRPRRRLRGVPPGAAAARRALRAQRDRDGPGRADEAGASCGSATRSASRSTPSTLRAAASICSPWRCGDGEAKAQGRGGRRRHQPPRPAPVRASSRHSRPGSSCSGPRSRRCARAVPSSATPTR